MVSSSVFIGFSPQTQTWYLSIVLHQHILIFLKIYPKKARKSRHFKPKISHFGHFHSFNWNYIPIFICICSLYTLSIGKTWFNVAKNWIIILQLNLKQLHKVNFYPSDNNFTQALLVCLWQISSLFTQCTNNCFCFLCLELEALSLDIATDLTKQQNQSSYHYSENQCVLWTFYFLTLKIAKYNSLLLLLQNQPSHPICKFMTNIRPL